MSTASMAIAAATMAASLLLIAMSIRNGLRAQRLISGYSDSLAAALRKDRSATGRVTGGAPVSLGDHAPLALAEFRDDAGNLRVATGPWVSSVRIDRGRAKGAPEVVDGEVLVMPEALARALGVRAGALSPVQLPAGGRRRHAAAMTRSELLAPLGDAGAGTDPAWDRAFAMSALMPLAPVGSRVRVVYDEEDAEIVVDDRRGDVGTSDAWLRSAAWGSWASAAAECAAALALALFALAAFA